MDPLDLAAAATVGLGQSVEPVWASQLSQGSKLIPPNIKHPQAPNNKYPMQKRADILRLCFLLGGWGCLALGGRDGLGFLSVFASSWGNGMSVFLVIATKYTPWLISLHMDAGGLYRCI